MAYRVVQGSRGPRRSFAVTVGLREGYGPDARTHTIEEAVEALLEWMKACAARCSPYITGTVSSGEVVYAWPEGQGKAGGGHEPVAIFSGEVSPLYNAGLGDDAVAELLNTVASALGARFGQTRVYVAYRDETWVLQSPSAETPTGD